jgi:hypothetical protein
MVIKEGAHMCAVVVDALMEVVVADVLMEAVVADALMEAVVAADVLIEVVAKEVSGCLFVAIVSSHLIRANIVDMGVRVEMSILSAQIVQINILLSLSLVLLIPQKDQGRLRFRLKYQHPCW